LCVVSLDLYVFKCSMCWLNNDFTDEVLDLLHPFCIWIFKRCSYCEIGVFFNCKCWFFQDQLLSSMQQKLDDLCHELNLAKDQSGAVSKVSDHDYPQSALKEKFGSERINFVDCGCWLCDQHHHSSPAVQVCLCVCSLLFHGNHWASVYDLILNMFSLIILFRIKLPQIWCLMQSQRKGVCLTCQIGVLVSLLLQKPMYVKNMWNLLKQSLWWILLQMNTHLV